MKKIILIIICLIILVIIEANKSDCNKLSGLDYDRCVMIEVKGR